MNGTFFITSCQITMAQDSGQDSRQCDEQSRWAALAACVLMPCRETHLYMWIRLVSLNGTFAAFKAFELDTAICRAFVMCDHVVLLYTNDELHLLKSLYLSISLGPLERVNNVGSKSHFLRYDSCVYVNSCSGCLPGWAALSINSSPHPLCPLNYWVLVLSELG